MSADGFIGIHIDEFIFLVDRGVFGQVGCGYGGAEVADREEDDEDAEYGDYLFQFEKRLLCLVVSRETNDFMWGGNKRHYLGGDFAIVFTTSTHSNINS